MIVWWPRVIFCVVLIGCSLYAVRNGLRNLLNGRISWGWSWLCGALICSELAVFNLRFGMVMWVIERVQRMWLAA
jgi:hypothetical protein